MSLIVEDGTIVTGAESYVTLAAADAYLQRAAKGAEWAAKPDATRENLLVQAARIIDATVTWAGTKASFTQPMQWPRVNVPYDGVDPSGFPGTVPAVRSGYYPESTIPPEVKQAQMEMAILQMEGDRAAPWDGSGIKRVNLGDSAMEVEFDPTTAPATVPASVMSLLEQFATGVDAGSGFRMVKVFRA